MAPPVAGGPDAAHARWISTGDHGVRHRPQGVVDQHMHGDYSMRNSHRSRVAIACQGGGSHTAFTAGVLQGLLANLPDDVEVVVLSGTSGGGFCAALAWDGLLHGDPRRGVRKLEEFWSDVAATEPLDRWVNDVLLDVLALRDLVTLPATSPYQVPPWGEDRFRAMLVKHFDCEDLRRRAAENQARARAEGREKGEPGLYIGAVDVLTGHFEVFEGPELCIECLLASAAIPELFRAVPIEGRGVYWDGLFSQNPPIHDLTDYRIDELWLIQINRSTCLRVPSEPHEILDRRNQLAGNLSMEQELKFIEFVNRSLRSGLIDGEKFRPVEVLRLPLDRDLDSRSKLDRRPEFLKELMEYGRAKSRWFLKERELKTQSLKTVDDPSAHASLGNGEAAVEVSRSGA
jgi:NTE family protein